MVPPWPCNTSRPLRCRTLGIGGFFAALSATAISLHLSAPLVLGPLRHRVSPYRLDLSVAETAAFAVIFMLAVGVAFFWL